MNPLEFAMKMELDGKAYYEEHAAKQENPLLKRLLLEMAGDEQKHFNLFKAMFEGQPETYDENLKTTIFETTKNIFETMKSEGNEPVFSADACDVWIKARDVEKEAEKFYSEKANEADNDAQRQLLLKIADEEHRHWQVLENVIQFVRGPKNFLETAEWNNLEE